MSEKLYNDSFRVNPRDFLHKNTLVVWTTELTKDAKGGIVGRRSNYSKRSNVIL